MDEDARNWCFSVNAQHAQTNAQLNGSRDNARELLKGIQDSDFAVDSHHGLTILQGGDFAVAATV